jgi:glycosyltransferase involved in cell wall biosynthesis
MRIAIVMRAIDQDSGFHLYLDGLIEALLKIDQDNAYLLFYRTPKWFGRFSSHKNVTEYILKAPHKVLWDQIAVPYAAWKYKADVVFNPKFSVPLISHCPVVMGIQEPAWWTWPEHYEKWDVLYQKLMLPLYARKASHVFAMTQWDLDENRKYLGAPLDHATIAYPGMHEHLKPVTDQAMLTEFRAKYGLPDKFILSMTRVDNPGMDSSKKWNPSKNPHTTLRAFIHCRDKIPHHLVFAGRNVRNYFLDNGFTAEDFERVHFIPFVPFNEIQNIHSLSELIVAPSYYESFSFTLLGAMACGCPSIVSTIGGFYEVVGDAALYANPHSPEDFAEKIVQLLGDEELRQSLKRTSLERAARYTWENTARPILEGLTRTVEGR